MADSLSASPWDSNGVSWYTMQYAPGGRPDLQALQFQVADLTYKLCSTEANLQECIQDSQQMMQSMKNMQPSVLW